MPHLRANGIQLYYEERGSGDPLLLIMGITAPGSVWEKHVAYWEQHYRCILVDNRGVGFSDKPQGPYTTAQMADDHAELLKSLGISNAGVVGVSMGGTIAQQLALRHPEMVKTMVLMCPWARCDRKGEAIFKHMMHAKAHLRPEDFSNFVQLLIYHKSSWDQDNVYDELMQAQQDAALDPFPQPLHGLEGQAHACISHHVLADLPKIKQPCLVIGGREDMFVPAWMVREVAEAIPGAELHLYEDAGHAFHWEKIEDFNPRVLHWLKEH
ncbi:alpha/beta fold hydrolase [Catalinimonas niigatensis]|uniref:alpha/beta fold hydrolase n=1 Tax=Catalinimonas niigatensis TaxID=1397264 RepID=UPI002665B724|nr:alpha/beta hydrolase [Catalinimonas niigatensis]WPP50342.1 alpha/beta hydrolase [Catalinimonas niigatensis]